MVYIFLQGWRATLIPLLAVPVSLIGTFMVFPMLGFSINTLSLFGLVLAIGLVVDDAIVVVEAVEHHIEEGMTPQDAALKAMEEVCGTGHRHRPHPGGGVYPDRFRSRHHRPALSAVRRDHRDFGDCSRPSMRSRSARRCRPCCCDPKKESRGPLGAFFRWFNKVFGRATDGYVGICRHLIHKAGFAFILLGILCVELPSSARRSRELPSRRRSGIHVRRSATAGCIVVCSVLSGRPTGREDHMNTPGVENVSTVLDTAC